MSHDVSRLSLLPIVCPEIRYFSIGTEEMSSRSAVQHELSSRLDRIGKKLLVDNKYKSSTPFGNFTVCENNKVVGFEFVPLSKLTCDVPKLVGFLPNDPSVLSSVGRFERYRYEQEKKQSGQFRLTSLDSLLEIDGLAYIHLSDVAYDSGVWGSLQRLAHNDLRGISVFGTRELFEVWRGESVKQIWGISAHVTSLEDIAFIDTAFPELKYLSLSISRELFIGIITEGILAGEMFKNVHTLRMNNSIDLPRPWNYFEYNDQFLIHERIDIHEARFKYSDRWLPVNVERVYLNSNLLTLRELILCNRMSSMKKGVEFVSEGYGYSPGIFSVQGAVSIRPSHYHEDLTLLENAWRGLTEGMTQETEQGAGLKKGLGAEKGVERKM
jgi:hypothetical protein